MVTIHRQQTNTLPARNSQPVTKEAHKIIAPRGARLCRVNVRIQSGQPLQKMVLEAGPDTKPDAKIYGVRDLWLPTGTKVLEEEMILLNGIRSWNMALGWAGEWGLEPTNAYSVFGIGKKYHRFHRQVGMNPTLVISTREIFFEDECQVVGVHWNRDLRKVCLEKVTNCHLPEVWYAFQKKQR